MGIILTFYRSCGVNIFPSKNWILLLTLYVNRFNFNVWLRIVITYFNIHNTYFIYIIKRWYIPKHDLIKQVKYCPNMCVKSLSKLLSIIIYDVCRNINGKQTYYFHKWPYRYRFWFVRKNHLPWKSVTKLLLKNYVDVSIQKKIFWNWNRIHLSYKIQQKQCSFTGFYDCREIHTNRVDEHNKCGFCDAYTPWNQCLFSPRFLSSSREPKGSI